MTRPPMFCRVNCQCTTCGRVRLHLSKRPRKSAKPAPVDEAALALQQAVGTMARAAKDVS